MFAAIDTETTGFAEDENARVIEVGAALFEDDGTLVRSFSELVCPDVITDEGLAVAMRVCGIEPHEIFRAPPPHIVWRMLTEFMDGWIYPLWCWNIEFDRPMIKLSFDRDPVQWAGCIMLEFSEVYAPMAGYHAETDTVRFMSLKRAAKLTKVPWEGDAHRARADSIMAGRIHAGVRNGLFRPPDPHKDNYTGAVSADPKKSALPPCGIGPISPMARRAKRPRPAPADLPAFGTGPIAPAASRRRRPATSPPVTGPIRVKETP